MRQRDDIEGYRGAQKTLTNQKDFTETCIKTFNKSCDYQHLFQVGFPGERSHCQIRGLRYQSISNNLFLANKDLEKLHTTLLYLKE